jgi:hypothetical protein
MTLQKNGGAVWCFANVLKFSAWLQALPSKMMPPPFRLIQISSAFWLSRCLYVAAVLDIASCLGDDTLPCADIAARVGAEPDATYRLLRMLAANGVFDEHASRCFRNNKLSSFLRTDNAQNVRAMILMHNSEIMSRPWFEQLERGVREGSVPFELAHGQELYRYMDSHAAFDTLFSQAMDSVEALAGESFAADFDWGRFERVIDVGGSRGSKAVTILKHHAHLKALVVDRAQVIAAAEAHWAGHGEQALLGRMHFQVGDAMNAIPAATSNGDIYLLSAVLHGFDDGGAAQVLQNVAAAIGTTAARVALLELVVPAANTDLTTASFDMQMFMGTRGRERTLAEWQRLFARSGLSLEEVVSLRSFGKLLVLRRA